MRHNLSEGKPPETASYSSINKKTFTIPQEESLKKTITNFQDQRADVSGHMEKGVIVQESSFLTESTELKTTLLVPYFQIIYLEPNIIAQILYFSYANWHKTRYW